MKRFYIVYSCCLFLFSSVVALGKNSSNDLAPKFDGAQTFSMNISSAPPYDPATMVTVRYVYSCSSLTTGCGNLTITSVVPTNLEYAFHATPPGTTASYDNGSRTITIVRNPYSDGNSGEVLVTFFISPTATGTINLPGTSVITDPTDPANGTLNASVDINVSNVTPAPNYSITKIKSAPSGTPAAGTNVTYDIEVKANQINGNVDIAPLTITDTFPSGATVIDAAGGTVAGNTITWTETSTNLIANWRGAISNGMFPTNFRVAFKRIILFYPAGTTGPVTNNACATGTSAYGNLNICADAVHNFATGSALLTLTKTASLTATAGGTADFFIEGNASNGNLPLDNLVIEDAIPAGYPLVNLGKGTWAPANVKAKIEYSTDNKASWNVIDANACHDFCVTDYVVGTNFPAGVTHVRYTFFDDGDANLPNQVDASWGIQNPIRVRLSVPAGTANGATIQNCAMGTANNASSVNPCATHTVSTGVPSIAIIKTMPGSDALKPGEEAEVILKLSNDGTAGLINPIVTDLLPTELEFVRWSSYTQSYPGGGPAPNMEVISNYNGLNRTLLRWTWQNTAPAGSVDVNGNAGAANPWTMQNAALPYDYVGFPEIRFIVRIKPGTPITSGVNSGLFTGTNPTIQCSGNATVREVSDEDGDGAANEYLCGYNRPFSVIAAVVMGAEKWIRGNASLPNIDDPSSVPAIPNAFCPTLDGSYTRFPCIARTIPGGTFDYKIKLINYGNLPLKDYVAYDVFPFMGDTGVSEILTSQTRNTQWVPILNSAPTAADAYTSSVLALPGTEIAYTFSTNPCRPEMSNSANESGWQVGCTNDWTTSVTDWSTVKGFRLKVPFTNAPYWEPGKEIILNVPMRVPPGAPFETVAWNSIAHRSTNAGNDASVSTTRLDTAEPRKVGIAIPPSSMISCLINSFTVTPTCNNNGTPTDASDDYRTFDVSATGTGTSATYNASVNNGGVLAPTSGTFGSATSFRLQNGSAGNTINYTLTVTDAANASCTQTTSVSDTGACSNTPPACSINAPNVFPVCNNNGTNADPNDDTFTYTIYATGTNTATTYNIGGDDTRSGVIYGQTQGPYGNFPISGGNKTITLTDATTNSCTNGPVVITAPAPCSSLTTGSLQVSKVVTGAPVGFVSPNYAIVVDCSDNTFDQTINLTAGNNQTISNIPAGTTCTITEPTQPTAPTGYAYGAAVINPSGAQTITAGTTVSVTITNPLTANPVCSINAPTVTPVCLDNGTPSDPSDDTFTFTINATGTSTGATYKVDKTAPTPASTPFASVTYGTTSVASPAFPISGGALTLTLTDNTTTTCMLNNVTITPPATCSNTPIADLELTKVADKTQVRVGDTLTYTLRLVNKGPSTAVNVKIKDTLPIGVSFVSASPSLGTYNQTTGIWAVDSLTNGQVVTLQIVVTIQ